ncbi:MAG TPA: hypothetical protein VFC00_39625 [Micromonosporaceae bacterium]|nr:hypothetical protein [Micromonosporaceae bacterium]
MGGLVKRSLSILFTLLIAGLATIVFAAPAHADNGHVVIGQQSFYINGLLRSKTWGEAYDYSDYPYTRIGGTLAVNDARNDGLCAWARVNYYADYGYLLSIKTEYFMNCTPGTTSYHPLSAATYNWDPHVVAVGVSPGVWCSCGASLGTEELWRIR